MSQYVIYGICCLTKQQKHLETHHGAPDKEKDGFFFLYVIKQPPEKGNPDVSSSTSVLCSAHVMYAML